MRKIYLLLVLSCLSMALHAQTAASYAFARTTGTLATIVGGSGTSSTSSLAGDDYYATFPIGFTFKYCGTNYTQAVACSNGWITLSNTTTSGTSSYYNNDGGIASYAFNAGVGFLMPFWDDNDGSGHTAYYQTSGTAPNRVFTFEWVSFGSLTGAGNGTMQLKLYESSNVIQFIYGTSSYSGHTATIGISNSGSDFQGLAAPTSTSTTTTFTATLANAPAANSILTWTPPPTASASPSSLAFSTLLGTVSASQTTTVNASGLTSSPITVSASSNYQVYNGSAWVSSYTIATSTNGGLYVNAAIPVQFTSPPAAGTYTGTVTITGGGLSTTIIALTGTALAPCSGTPTGGNASISPASGNTGTTFALNVSGSTVAGSLTYQWQSSPNNSTWTDISGATGNSYSFSGLTANTYYRRMTICVGSSTSSASTSTVATFFTPSTCTIPSAPGGVCCGFYVAYPGMPFICPGDSSTAIYDSVALSTANYLDRVGALSCKMHAGGTYTVSIGGGSVNNNGMQVWIDFNGNGTFSSAESVGGINWAPSTTVQHPVLTIPVSGVTPGNYRMRVAVDYTGGTLTGSLPNYPAYPNLQPCGSPMQYYEIRDYMVTVVPPPPCTGTPTAGTASITPLSGSTATTFSLSLSGTTVASGLTYQWQSSTDDSTWTNISGATASGYSFSGLTGPMYYKASVTCPSFAPAVSNTVSAVYLAAVASCSPTSSSWSAVSSYTFGVSSVSISAPLASFTDTAIISTINTTTGYVNKTGTLPSITLYKGGVYPSSVSYGSLSAYQEAQIWIDFNDDGVFSTSEEVTGVIGNGITITTINPVNFNITIPSSASTGFHLMRMRGIWELTSSTLGVYPAHLDPCLINYSGGNPQYYSGTAVDYLVNIQPPPACTGTPTAGVAHVTPASGASATSFALSLTGVSVASSLTYQWQSSPDSTTWTNVSGATASTYSFTGISTSTYFRCIVGCSATSTSATSVMCRAIRLAPSSCTPSAASGSSAYYVGTTGNPVIITGISGSSISDASVSGSGTGGSAWYYNNVTMSVNMYAGGVYSATIGAGYYYNSGQIWVDFNDDGVFNDSTETIGGYTTYSVCCTIGPRANVTLNIPYGANAGAHRMRVMNGYCGTYGPGGNPNYPTYPLMNPCPNAVTTVYYADTRDYMVNIITPDSCTVPSAQPTALTLTSGLFNIAGSFTAASPSADNYLVIATTSSMAPSAPSNGLFYTPGTAALGGVVVSAGSGTSFNYTGLTPGTTYWFWVYSYNSVCSGGTPPYYRTSFPLSNNTSTASCALSGVKTVGPTGDYTTIAAAITDINTQGLTGNLALELQTTYTGETFPVNIGALSMCSPGKTLTIRPQGTMTVTGTSTTMFNLTGAANVIIDGRVGSTGTTKALTISNTNTSGSVIAYANGASNNVVKYCAMKSVNTSTGTIVFGTTTTTSGNNNNRIDNCDIFDGSTQPLNGIYASGNATLGLENTSDSITNCNIYNYYGAASISTGIEIFSGNSLWVISNNKFYQTAARTYTGSQFNKAIYISSSNGGYLISGNTIGYASAAATGVYSMTSTSTTTFAGIYVFASSTGVPTSIQGNTISGISFTTASTASTLNGAFCGIYVSGGNVDVGTITPNVIGSASGNGAITTTINTNTGGTMTGIGAGVSNPSMVNIQNNVIGSLTLVNGSTSLGGGINGIQISSTGSYSVTGNTIGSTTTSNSLYMPTVTTGTQLLYGINCSATITNFMQPAIANNTIANLTALGTGSASLAAGIINTSNASTTISGNSISNISSATSNTSASGQTGVQGIGYYGNTLPAATITNNTISNISNTNTTAIGTTVSGIGVTNAIGPVIAGNKIWDIRNANTGTSATAPPKAVGILIGTPTTTGATISNNMISLGNAQTTNTSFCGILNISTGSLPTNVYYNTVNIEGTVTSGALPSVCMMRGNFSATALTTPVDIRNNIFTNSRSGGTGKHYAIANCLGATGTSTGWGASASNFNIFNAASTTVGYWGAADKTFSAWISSSNGDGNSYTGATITFANTATGDLHINMGTTANNLESHGTVIPGLATDFDGNTRPGPSGSTNGWGIAPDMGADEFDGVAIDNIGPVITYTALLPSCDTNNRTFSATLIDPTGVPTTGTSVPRVYFRKGSGSWFSQPGTLTSGTGTNGVWSFTITNSSMGGVIPSDFVSYYIVAQDNSGNVSASPVAGLVAADVNTVTSAPSSPNGYAVLSTLGGTYNVGVGQAYTTITSAVNAYNNSCLTGAVTFVLTDASYSSETFPITINANVFSSATNTLTIKPAAGTAVSVTGTTSAAAIFKLLGASNVTIDGVNTGGSSLTLTNTNTSTSANIWLASTSAGNGCSNVTLKKMNITGGSVSTTADWGILAGIDGTVPSTNAGQNNDNITIQNNTFRKCGYGIFATGTGAVSAGGLDNWEISGNTFGPATYSTTDNIAYYGVSLSGMVNPVVSNNTFQNIGFTTLSAQTIGISLTSNINGATVNQNTINGVFSNYPTSGVTNECGIYVGSGVINSMVSRNTLTNIYDANTGGYAPRGITINTNASSSNDVIANNMISNVYGTSWSIISEAPVGIAIEGLSGGVKVYFNTINLATSFAGSNLGTFSAGLYVSTSGNNIDVRNNIFANSFDNTTVSYDRNYAIYSTAPATAFSNLDYNVYYVSAGNPLANIASTDKMNLSALQAAFGGNTHSLALQPAFVSGTDPHLTSVAANAPLQSGIAISSPAITIDIDGATRGTTPVIGAHELTVPPAISYEPLSAMSCGAGTLVLNDVSITDFYGVPTSGSLMPRVYFRKGLGAWSSNAGTLLSGTGTSGVWSFAIGDSSMGSLSDGDVISYYIIAQNTMGSIVANPFMGLAATDVNTVTTPPSTPNSTTISMPGSFTGVTMVCVGSTTTLTNSVTGGMWFSANDSLAATDSFGTVTGISAGVVVISYMLPVSGCSAAITVTVSPLAYAGTISGPSSGCTGTGLTLSSSVSGGTWSAADSMLMVSGGVVTASVPGIYTISYTVTNSCGTDVATKTVTINTAPDAGAITGTESICTGSTAMMSNSVSGGMWSISGSSASIDSFGTVTGMSVGSVMVSYGVSNSCGTTYATHMVNIISTPSAGVISGPSTVGIGSAITLSDSTGGGTWSASNSHATVSSSGVVTGVSAGTVTISYTVSNSCGSATVTTVVTVNSLSPITGTLTVCAGSATTLSDATTGGTWSSGATSVATVVSSTGVVTGVSAGTATITYSLSGNLVTAVVTVNSLPATISGPAIVCLGSSITLSDATSGGAWVSANSSIASVDEAGIVTGVTTGTVVISYIASTGCYRTFSVTVRPLPAAIGGATSVCVGATATLTDGTSGGTWSSSATAIGTVSSTGVIAGISSGTALITYTLSTGCFVTKMVTVNDLPTAISGTTVVCIGATTSLSSTPSEGIWTSGTTSKATVDATTGVVTGVAAGTSVISYTTAGGCRTTTVVTVLALPNAITGTTSVCLGSTTALSTTSTGGTWSSSDDSVATVGSTGIVSGLATGTAIISYTNASGCSRTATVTVGSGIPDIIGSSAVCVGKTTTLSDSVTGGTWSSSTTSVATITSAGVVTGVAAGTVNITYTYTAGCRNIKPMTVNPAAATITGTTSVCVNSSIALSTTNTGGTWSSSNDAMGTVDASGNVTGISAGTITITYTLSTGCFATKSITVKALPGAISGVTSVCIGSTTALTDAGGSGWTSGSTAIATVGATSGVVTGVSEGTVSITYSLSSGCTTSTIVTVNPLPSAISGVSSVCIGSATALSSATPDGAWASGTTTKATVDAATGVVTGVAAGTSTISYTIGTGCRATVIVTVLAVPNTISGATTMCIGTASTLTCSTTGGAWSSSNDSVAAVSSGGVVTGMTTGTAAISYTLATGCARVVVVTVNTGVADIAGSSTVCVGKTTTLTDATSGGAWSSGTTSIATVNSAGLVTGVAVGTVNITYTVSAGCKTSKTMTVNAAAATLTGTTTVCVGSSIALGTTNTGGTWSSSNTALGIVDSMGNVTGVSAGTVNISYTLSTGCFATKAITVRPLPAAIAGTAALCVGATTTLTDPTSGGVSWMSSDASVATVGSISGVVTGVALGTSTITYTLSTGCSTTRVVSVNSMPSAISGTAIVCAGATTALSASSSADGTWSSSTVSKATVDALTGVVTGVAAGTARITFSAGAGCFTTMVVTVLAAPNVITGTATVCVGATTALSTTSTGGTWSSSSTAVATVGTSGIVTGNASGTATISYTNASGCSRSVVVTVNEGVSPVTGSSTVCLGSTTTLSDATSDGTWSSSNTDIAAINSDGLVSGLALGSVTITYAAGAGCPGIFALTVSSGPAITGAASICAGVTATLSTAASGGTWSSGITGTATIDGSGNVTAVAAGTAAISYVADGCISLLVVTVNPQPAAITGYTAVCAGSTSALSTTSTGGTWSSSNTGVATVSTGGVVSGVSAGTANISYTFSGGCAATATVTVNTPLSANTGSAFITVGSTTTLSNAVTGGTWTSSNTSLATVDSSGVITGVAVGYPYITYTAGGCRAVTLATVVATVSPITGTFGVCVGNTTTLSDASTGASWSSSTPSVAAIGSLSGVVTGISAGTSVITFFASSGAYATAVITVNGVPSVINGPSTVCVGSTIALTDSATGGTWSSSSTVAGTIDATTGILTGLFNGATTITYSLNGCARTKSVSVNPIPAAISGTAYICIGSTSTLTGPTGGAWSSTNTSIATVGSTGIVTGIGAGTTTISYTLSTGCARAQIVTVAAMTANVGGTLLCIGIGMTITNPTSGGTWSTSSPAIATIGATTGLASGVALGTVNLTYTLSPGCRAITFATVNSTPATISGTASVCVGNTTSLSDATTGGSWVSSNPSLGSVSFTGVVTGITAGTPVISYVMPGTGCYRTLSVPVKVLPAAIGGSSTVCTGSTVTVTDASSPGAWSSSTPAVGTIGGSSGVLGGISVGTTTITFTATSTGCFITRVQTVNTAGSVSGPTSVSITSSATTPAVYTDAVSGGTWSTSNATRATIDAGGNLTGHAAGTVTVSYAVSGCTAVYPITITTPRAAGEQAQGIDPQLSAITIYPNPANGAFSVNSDDAGVLSVFTIDGNILATYNVDKGITTIALPKDIASGIYVCRFNGENGNTATIRLVYGQ